MSDTDIKDKPHGASPSVGSVVFGPTGTGPIKWTEPMDPKSWNTAIQQRDAEIERLRKVVDAAIRWKVETVADDDDMERYEAEDALIAAVREYLPHRPELKEGNDERG